MPIFQVESQLAEEPSASALAAFLLPYGPLKLLVYIASAKGKKDADGVAYTDDEMVVFVALGDTDIFAERGVLLLKSGEGVTLDSVQAIETQVSCTVVLGSPVKSLLATIEHVYQPALSSAVGSWGAQLSDNGDEFFSAVGKYVGMLGEAVQTVEGGVELAHPSLRNTELIEMKTAAYGRASQSPDIVASYEAAVTSWCTTVEELVSAAPAAAHLVPEGEEGPSSELDYWKGRMQRFASVSEQLRSRENRVIVGVLGQTRSNVLRRWKALEPPITDGSNEAKDNVKYLAALEKFLEPLENGTPSAIADCLPGIFSNIKMMCASERRGHARCCCHHRCRRRLFRYRRRRSSSSFLLPLLLLRAGIAAACGARLSKLRSPNAWRTIAQCYLYVPLPYTYPC